jgi:ABC-2 type transport system permease protein
VSCLVALLLLYVISWPADTSGEGMAAVLRYLSLTEHFGEMVKGIIDTRDLVYFGSVIVLALFLTQRSVESLRWR